MSKTGILILSIICFALASASPEQHQVSNKTREQLKIAADSLKTTLMVGTLALHLPESVKGVELAMMATFFLQDILFPGLRALDKLCRPVVTIASAIPMFLLAIHWIEMGIIEHGLDPYVVEAYIIGTMMFVSFSIVPAVFFCGPSFDDFLF